MLARTPWTPPLKAKAKPKQRKLAAGRRKHFVDQTAFILRHGEPTHFAFEASCRHDIRSRLCLEGWKWAEADIIAAEIVATALSRIGAKRPTWLQGQPEYAHTQADRQEATRCRNCGGGMPPENAIYCSVNCRKNYIRRKHYHDNRAYMQAKQRAHWQAWREKQPLQDCPMCGEPFRPNYPKQKLCSNRCAVQKMKNHVRTIHAF